MTYYKVVTLSCDGPGEQYPDWDGCLNDYEHDRGTATEAREYAERAGWVNDGGDDYCPDCAEELGLSTTDTDRSGGGA